MFIFPSSIRPEDGLGRGIDDEGQSSQHLGQNHQSTHGSFEDVERVTINNAHSNNNESNTTNYNNERTRLLGDVDSIGFYESSDGGENETSLSTPRTRNRNTISSLNCTNITSSEQQLQQQVQQADGTNIDQNENDEVPENDEGVENNNEYDNNYDDDDGNSFDSIADAERTIVSLTRRLRCMFSIVTWPIVPLASIAFVAMLYFVYAAAFLDVATGRVDNDTATNSDTDFDNSSIDNIRTSTGCSHPMKEYALLTVMIAVYTPYHKLIRERIFHYRRDRDGPNRPLYVRRYDQLVHTLALLYVYGGMTLLESCREDIMTTTTTTTTKSIATMTIGTNGTIVQDPYDTNLNAVAHENPVLGVDVTEFLNYNSSTPAAKSSIDDATIGTDTTTTIMTDNDNTCHLTCPNLTAAFTIYIATLELFTVSLIIPLLFVPCIYLWFVRQATTTISNHEALNAVLHRRLRTDDEDDDDNDNNQNDGGLMFGDIGTGNNSSTGSSSNAVSVDDILAQLQTVRLVRRRKGHRTLSTQCDVDDDIWFDKSQSTDNASTGSSSSSHEIWIVPKRSRHYQQQKQQKELKQEESSNINHWWEKLVSITNHNNRDKIDVCDGDIGHVGSSVADDNEESSVSSTYLCDDVVVPNNNNTTSSDSSSVVDKSSAMPECCICICRFIIHEEDHNTDIETGPVRTNKYNKLEDDDGVQEPLQVATTTWNTMTEISSTIGSTTATSLSNSSLVGLQAIPTIQRENSPSTARVAVSRNGLMNSLEVNTTEKNCTNVNSDTGTSSGTDLEKDDNDDDDDGIDTLVRTRSCKHLFHKRCIASWIGGKWQPQQQSHQNDRTVGSSSSSGNNTSRTPEQRHRRRSNHTTARNNSTPTTTIGTSSTTTTTTVPRRIRNNRVIRARRTTCPLCRQDLRQPSKRRTAPTAVRTTTTTTTTPPSTGRRPTSNRSEIGLDNIATTTTTTRAIGENNTVRTATTVARSTYNTF